jgi:asparagine synthase (glutamine-hydrolysing)
MCGICGIVAEDRIPDRDELAAMMGQLVHRGPDGAGLFRDSRAALGHLRLSIIDTEGGAQPLSNEDGTVWVSFNGEIFNYVELREHLRDLGHTFRTASDTEVIVHAWEQWGEDCFSRFNGQWALALWETRRGRLILSRDRMGIRPLYYTGAGSRFRFASEVKALFAATDVPRELDPDGLDETFTYWSTVAPRTVFAGIDQLPPGHYLVRENGRIRIRPYWSPDFPQRGHEPHTDLVENVAALREAMVTATRLRFLRSDVPVGAYLSGGLDSSITAAVIARHTDVPVHTFSLRFTDSAFDEGEYQQRISASLGTRHQDVTVSGADVAGVFPEVVRHAETPVLRAAPAPLFLLSRLVREHGYKVVVTGEGADEVLAGYDIFREARVRQFWARDPGSAVRSRAAELLYPWMARSPGQVPAFARAFFGRDLDPADPALSHRPRWQSTSVLKNLVTTGLRERMSADRPLDLIAGMPPRSPGWDPLSRAQWLEMTTLLPGYILASQGDRMLMANSVEGRFPFLDRNVVELANAVPAGHKLFGLEEKYLLKQAFADLVPPEILQRPKQPYRAPDAASFVADPTSEWFAEVTSERAVREAGTFRPDLVAGLVAKCRRAAGRAMSNTDDMRLLAVVSTQLLYEQFISSDRDRSRTALPHLDVVVDLVAGGHRTPITEETRS